MFDATAYSVLLNWGKWVRKNPLSSLCYPSIEPYRKMYTMPGETIESQPDSQSAVIVDRLMAKFITRVGNPGVVFALYYITGFDYVHLANFIVSQKPGENIDRKKVSAWVGMGQAWFDGAYTGIELGEAA